LPRADPVHRGGVGRLQQRDDLRRDRSDDRQPEVLAPGTGRPPAHPYPATGVWPVEGLRSHRAAGAGGVGAPGVVDAVNLDSDYDVATHWQMSWLTSSGFSTCMKCPVPG